MDMCQSHCTKMKFSIKHFFSKCDQIRRNHLVIFTEEILNEKLHFLYSVHFVPMFQVCFRLCCNICCIILNCIEITPKHRTSIARIQRKLNVHSTFRRRPGSLLYIGCTFNLHSMSRGEYVRNDFR